MYVRNYTDPNGPEIQIVYKDWLVKATVHRDASREEINKALNVVLYMGIMKMVVLIILIFVVSGLLV